MAWHREAAANTADGLSVSFPKAPRPAGLAGLAGAGGLSATLDMMTQRCQQDGPNLLYASCTIRCLPHQPLENSTAQQVRRHSGQSGRQHNARASQHTNRQPEEMEEMGLPSRKGRHGTRMLTTLPQVPLIHRTVPTNLPTYLPSLPSLSRSPTNRRQHVCVFVRSLHLYCTYSTSVSITDIASMVLTTTMMMLYSCCST